MSALHPSTLVGYGVSPADMAGILLALEGDAASAPSAVHALDRAISAMSADLTSGRWMTPERRAADVAALSEAHRDREEIIGQMPGTLSELFGGYDHA